MHGFLVALAYLDEVLGPFASRSMAMFEVSCEIAALSAQTIGELIEGLEQFEDLTEMLFRKFALVGDIAQNHFLGTELNQDAIELSIVFDVLDALFTGDLVKRGLRDIDKSAFYQLGHLAVEEGQQEGPDVRAVDIRIGHDDDFMIAQLVETEGTLAVAVANSSAYGGDHRANFVILKDFIQAGFFHINELAADREDRLEF